ncbi:hypothetical protein DAPPUDRAFT_259451 [Daphnia pulex]|uniref:C-type lectin domain-containing protein n=1 Tax=Daphnia pulex TaxID=6669 RepID=E9HH90_DAPPU|nr:hypothetical protein DAPPUDRAFT_259451 [Daphnia pulex]|eukprot:EFX68908.1 hypothetical protein DAPPUDRAFT_259451 [Daphnia pulex]
MPCWTLGGKCDCFFTETVGKDWISADTFCKDEGMALLSLEIVEEDKLIYDHIKITPELNSVSYWTVGMYSLDGDKIWEWASTEPFQPFTCVNWSPGQPDNNGPGFRQAHSM